MVLEHMPAVARGEGQPGLLPDYEIERLARAGMIEPFVPVKTTEGTMPSYGLSSFGYDIRLADEFVWPEEGEVLDPCLPSAGAKWNTLSGSSFVLDPGHGVLARSVECFNMPDDVEGFVFGKSTNARCFLTLNCTPLEPGWRGGVTIEISNICQNPVRLTVGAGIGQVLFIRGHKPRKPYGAGRYQDQQGVTATKVAP